jgi:hypothetical protein
MSLRARMGQVAVVSAAVLSIVAACVGTDGLTPDGPTDGTNGPSAAAGRCPEAGPVNGELCFLPEGTTCVFGPCGAPIARCNEGYWQYSTHAHAPACPEKIPDIDQLCDDCWPSGATCVYGACSGPDASPNRAFVSCDPGTKWRFVFQSCDGGADVQGQ